MQATIKYLREGFRSAALRIVPPAASDADERIPTHFVALIDISDSMADNNKLGHVKHCLSLLLSFLTPADQLSLITFGDTATTLLRRVPMTAAAVATATSSIQSLRTNGCTNFSAGLAAVRELLEGGAGGQSGAERSEGGGPRGARQKEGLFILTDGHANRGVHNPVELRGIGGRLRELFPNLTTSFVAYGTDHNADLLKQMSEDVNGSYSIVTDLEGAALTMGESLGNLLSCAAQNVTVQFPSGTKLLGSGSSGRAITPGGRLVVGDLYTGVTQLLLVEFPRIAADLAADAGGEAVSLAPSSISIKGTMLPSLDSFQIDILEPAPAVSGQRDLEVELTEIRYRVADLYRRLREAPPQNGEQRAALQEELAAIRGSLADPIYAGQPLLELLQHELPSLTVAIEAAATYLQDTHGYRTQLLQHEAFVGLGRGTSQPMRLPVAEAFPIDYDDVGSDAGGDPDGGRSVPAARANESYLSPTTSRTARRVAVQLRTASQLPAAP
jgi:Ca-activated chloride channel family protein